MPGLRGHSVLPSLLILTLAVASGATLRGVIGPLQEAAQADLRLSDLQISLAQGLAGAVPVVLFSIPFGRLIDRSKRVRLLAIMAAISTLSALLTVIAPGFCLLFVARMLAALGSLGAIQVAISLAADMSSRARRGRTLLLVQLGISMGNAAAFAFGGWMFGWLGSGGLSVLGIGSMAPWRGVHLLAGVVSCLVILLTLILPEPSRHEVGQSPPAALGPALRDLWSLKAFLIPIFIGQIAVLMADTAAWIWAAPVLVREFGLRPENFGGWMGLLLLLSGAAGAIAGGIVADLGNRTNIRGGILLGAVVAAALSVPAAFFALAPNVATFGALLALLLFSGAVMALVATTAIAVSVPNELRGVCLGVLFVVSSIGGFAIAPTLVTLVARALGGAHHLAGALAVTDVVIGFAAMFAFFWAMKFTPSAPRSLSPHS